MSRRKSQQHENPDLVSGSLDFVDLVNGLGRVKGIDGSKNGLEFNSSKPFVVGSTFSGELLVYTADLVNGVLDFVDSVNGLWRVKGIDVSENGLEFVSVGEDGRVNWVGLDVGKLSERKIFDSNGLVSHGAVKWASLVFDSNVLVSYGAVK
ncbi:hypothetical protein CQW23_21332 [Capsicum baccatum]|uniref:Uncharacterized protein n=1 Tax=Capsicum baccatum TaxID=33114 RepID=A0A2G2VXS4_CAPBA|nr:hypothetical protein CQW23_21332 [Capsicum baccatum]